MTEIPAAFYAIIGILVVANVGTLGALVVFIFKVGMFVQSTKSGIRETREMSVRAHKRIDTLILNRGDDFDGKSL
jgi:hypothetical protein